VASTPRETITARRLEQLRRAHPADATLQNLLAVLASKLELSARLPVFEYEAASEGHDDCAATFEALGTAERAHVNELLKVLRVHIDRAVARTSAPV
jgi:hypothetical protein